ncbi:Glutathione S-transferase Phi class fusion protein [Zostera marina]|uniref:glutathione transferase n=1 Tax=Zostera marina TaxID=29655 RepID=A0A0K9Q3R3_ZOSMR|nr:Glutathione S-transferase Phi class fusion protein [Zostera marina]
MTDAVVKVYFGNLMMLPDVSRVITCLHEKNVKFDLINMSKERKHTVPFDFLKLQENPSSRVLGPVFDDGSKMLFESREICRYLPENYAEQGNKYLLGTNTLDRASIEQWIRSEKHSFDPPSWNLMFHLAFASLMDLEPKRALIQESEKKLSQLLDVYNQRLADSKFLAGNHFTLADLVHLPNTHYLANSKEWSYLFTSRKNVKKWWKKISQRESWLQTIQRIDQVVNEGRPSLVSSSSKGIVSRKSQVYPAKITELSIDDHISSPSKLKDHQQYFSLHKPETFQSPKKHKKKKKSTKSSKVASPRMSHQTEAFRQSNVHFDQLEENPLKRSISPISFGHDPLPIPQSKIISPSNKPTIEIEPSNPHDLPEIPFLEIESPKTEPIVHTQPIDIPTFNPQKSPPPTHKKKIQPKPSGKIATSIPHVHMPNWETYEFYEASMHPESNLPEHLHKTKKNIEDEVSQSHIFYSQKVPPETKYYKLEPTTSSIQHIQKITATPVENTTTEPKLRTKENSNQNPTFPVPLEPGTSYYKKESPKPSQENIENSTSAIHGFDQPQPTKQSQEPPSKNSTKETSSKLALFMPTQSEYVPYTKQPTVPHPGKTGIPEGNTLHTMNLKQRSSIPPETQVSVSKPSIDLSSHVQETNTHDQLDEHLKKEFAHTPINPSISVSQPNDFQLSQTKDDLPYPKSEDSQFIHLLDQMDEFNPSRKIHPSIVPQKEDLEPIGPKHETNHQKPPVHVFRRDSGEKKEKFGHKKAQDNQFSQNYMEKKENRNLSQSTYLSKSAQLESSKPLPAPVELETNTPSKQLNALQSPKAKNDLTYPNAENTEITDNLMKKKNEFISEEPGMISYLNLPKEENSKIHKHKDRTSECKPLDPFLSQDSKEKRADLSPPEHFLLKNTLSEPLNQSLNSPEPKSKAYLQSSEIKNDIQDIDSEDIQIIKYINKNNVDDLYPLGTTIPSVISEEDSNFSEPTVEISHQKSIDQPPSQESEKKRENLILQDLTASHKLTQLEYLQIEDELLESQAHELDARRPHEKSYKSDPHELEPSQHSHGNLEPFKLDKPKFIHQEDNRLYKPSSKIKLPAQDKSYLVEESKENNFFDKPKSPETASLEPTSQSLSVPEQKSLETLAETTHFELYNHERKTAQVFGQEKNATDFVDPTHKKVISTKLPILLNPQPFSNPSMQNGEKITPVIPEETTPTTKPKFPTQETNEFPISIKTSPQHVFQKKITPSQQPTVVDPHKYLSSDTPYHKIESPQPSQGNIEQFIGSINESDDHGYDQPQLIRNAQGIEFQKPELKNIEPFEQSLDSQTHKLEPLQNGQKESEKEFTQNLFRPFDPDSQSKDLRSSQTKIGIQYHESKDTQSIEYLDKMTEFDPKLSETETPMSQDTEENGTNLNDKNPQDKPVSDGSQEKRERKTLPVASQLVLFKKVPKSVESETQESLHYPDIQPQPQNDLSDQDSKDTEFSYYLEKKKNDFILENTNVSESKAKTIHQKPLDPSMNTSSQMSHPDTLKISEPPIDQKFQNSKSQEPVKETQVMPGETNTLRDLPKDVKSAERQMEEKETTYFLDSNLQSTQKEVILPSKLPTFMGKQPESSQLVQSFTEKKSSTPPKQIIDPSKLPKDSISVEQDVPRPLKNTSEKLPLPTQAKSPRSPKPLDEKKEDPNTSELPLLPTPENEAIHSFKPSQESLDKKRVSTSQSLIIPSTGADIDTSDIKSEPSKLTKFDKREELNNNQPPLLPTQDVRANQSFKLSNDSDMQKHKGQEIVKSSVEETFSSTMKPSPIPTSQEEPSKQTQMKTPIQEMLGEAASEHNQAETSLNQERLQPLQRVKISPIDTQSGFPKPVEEPLEKKEASTPQSIIIPSTEAGIYPIDVISEPFKLKKFYKKKESNTRQPPLLPDELDDGTNQSIKPSTESYMQKQQDERIVKSSVDEIISTAMKSSHLPTSQTELSRQAQTPVEGILGESSYQTEAPLIQEGFQLQQKKSLPIDNRYLKPAQEPLEKKETSTLDSIIIPTTQPEINLMNINSKPSKAITGTNENGEKLEKTRLPFLLTPNDGANQPHFKPASDSYKQMQQVPKDTERLDEYTISSSTMKPSHLPTSQSEPFKQAEKPVEEIHGESVYRQDQTEIPLTKKLFQPLQKVQSSLIDTSPGFPTNAEESMEKNETSTPQSILIRKTQPEIYPMNIKSGSSKDIKGTDEKGEGSKTGKPPTLAIQEDRANQPLINDFSQMSHPETLKISEPLINQDFQNPRLQEPLKETKVMSEATNALSDLPQGVKSVDRKMEEKEATNFLDSTLQYTQKEVNSPSELSTFLSNQQENPQPVQSFIEKKTSALQKQTIKPSKLDKDSIPVEQDVSKMPKNTLETLPLSKKTQMKTPIQEILGEAASQQNQAETPLNQERFQPLQRVQISPIATQSGIPKPEEEPLEKKEVSTPQSIIVPSTEAGIDPTDIKSEPSKLKNFYKKEESNTSQPSFLPELDDEPNQFSKPSTEPYMQKQQVQRILKSSADEIISSTMKLSHSLTSKAELIEEILDESSSQKDQAKPSLIQEGSQPFQQVQTLDTMKPTPISTFQSDPPKNVQTTIEKVFGQSPSEPTKMEAHFRQEDPQPFEQKLNSMAYTSKPFIYTKNFNEDKQISTPINNTQPEERSNPPQGPKENIKSSNIPKPYLSTPKDENHKLSEKLLETPKKEPNVSDYTESSLDETINSLIVNSPVLPFPNLESPKQIQTFAEKELSQNKPPTNTQGVPQSIEEVTSLTETQKKSSVHPQNLTGTSSFTKSSLPKDTSSSTKPFLPKDTSSSTKPTLPTPQNEVNQPFKLPIDSSSRTPSLKSNPSNNSRDTKPAQTSTEQIVRQNIFKTSEVALLSQENYPRPLDELERSETKSPEETPLAQNYSKPTPTKTQTDDKPSSINSPSSPQLPPPKKSQSPEPPTGP